MGQPVLSCTRTRERHFSHLARRFLLGDAAARNRGRRARCWSRTVAARPSARTTCQTPRRSSRGRFSSARGGRSEAEAEARRGGGGAPEPGRAPLPEVPAWRADSDSPADQVLIQANDVHSEQRSTRVPARSWDRARTRSASLPQRTRPGRSRRLTPGVARRVLGFRRSRSPIWIAPARSQKPSVRPSDAKLGTHHAGPAGRERRRGAAARRDLPYPASGGRRAIEDDGRPMQRPHQVAVGMQATG